MSKGPYLQPCPKACFLDQSRMRSVAFTLPSLIWVEVSGLKIFLSKQWNAHLRLYLYLQVLSRTWQGQPLSQKALSSWKGFAETLKQIITVWNKS